MGGVGDAERKRVSRRSGAGLPGMVPADTVAGKVAVAGHLPVEAS